MTMVTTVMMRRAVHTMYLCLQSNASPAYLARPSACSPSLPAHPPIYHACLPIHPFARPTAHLPHPSLPPPTPPNMHATIDGASIPPSSSLFALFVPSPLSSRLRPPPHTPFIFPPKGFLMHAPATSIGEIGMLSRTDSPWLCRRVRWRRDAPSAPTWGAPVLAPCSVWWCWCWWEGAPLGRVARVEPGPPCTAGGATERMRYSCSSRPRWCSASANSCSAAAAHGLGGSGGQARNSPAEGCHMGALYACVCELCVFVRMCVCGVCTCVRFVCMCVRCVGGACGVSKVRCSVQ